MWYTPSKAKYWHETDSEQAPQVAKHLKEDWLTVSGVARPKLMVGPDYRGTKEVLEDLTLAAPG